MNEWVQDSRLLATFKAEADERIESLSQGLVNLEQDPGNLELVNEIFRNAHTLKGSAGMMGYEHLKALAHKTEDVLAELRAGRSALAEEAIDVLLAAVDGLRVVLDKQLAGQASEESVAPLIERLEGILSRSSESAGGAAGHDEQEPRVSSPAQDRPTDSASTVEPLAKPETALPAEPPSPKAHRGVGRREDQREAPAASAEVAPENGQGEKAGSPPQGRQEPAAELTKPGPRVEESIRVNLTKFDQLLNLVGEVVINQGKTEQHVKDVAMLALDSKSLQRRVDQVQRRLQHPPTDERSVGQLHGEMQAICGAFEELHRRLIGRCDQFVDHLSEMAVVTRELQASAMNVRMLPISVVLTPLHRVARDLCRQQKKEVNLELEGDMTELDKRVLEQISDPLMHILRNAVDHGIEAPEDRRAAGKPTAGTVRFSTFQRGNQIVVEASDDGRGIDPHIIKEAAVKRGVVGASEDVTDEQALYLIFRSGFSTSPLITDVSGRGVGLDVVKTNIEKMQGNIHIESEPGQGTKFVITLPVTLAIFPALLVRVADQAFAIPLATVEETLKIAGSDVHTLENREAIYVRDQTIPLVRLDKLLGMPPGPSNGLHPVVVTSTVNRKMAFQVTELIGQQEVVIKSLGAYLPRVPNISGATIMGNGEVVLVLDMSELVYMARERSDQMVARPGPAVAEPTKDRNKVLVAEDSLTIRELERTILENAGFEVEVAVDGVDALNKSAQQDFHLVVTDIEMPGMDGFELTGQLRKSERFKDVPIIILTSRAKDEDKRRGIEVGADAYLVKSGFDQGNLLQTIERLIGD